MLRRDAGKSVSFQRGFRGRGSLRSGGAFLPFLALMLLAAPQAAFAQEKVNVTVSTNSLDVTEGSTATYTVKLDSQPSAEVVLTVVENSLAISAAPTTLTFTTDNFSDTQDVTVTAASDANAVDEKVTITHTATVDGKPATVDKAAVSVVVTVDDGGTRGVNVSVSTLTVGEANTADYTVVLTSEPTDTVTIDVGGASGEITVSPSRLTFTPGAAENTTGHWQQTQTVNVYAGEDFDNVDDTATLTHTVRGGDYTGESAASVAVTVNDNDDDRKTVNLSPTTVRIATGLSGSYTVALGSQPNGTVKISVTEDSASLSVSPTSLTFSKSNWKSPRTVRISTSGNEAADVTLNHALDTTSSGRDTAWDEVTVGSVTVREKDTRRVTLSETSLAVPEGRSARYNVVLDSQPTGDVTVSPAQIAFTRTNWSTARQVTVNADADEDGQTDPAVTLTHKVRGADLTNHALTHTVSGGGYASTITVSNVTVTVDDNDTLGLTVTPTDMEIVAGDRKTYSVVLNSKPTENVTVTPSGGGEITVSPVNLTFTQTNWNRAQNFILDVPLTASSASQTIVNTPSGGGYSDAVNFPVVNIKGTGEAGVAVSPTSLSITEGKSASYTVVLSKEPTATVTIDISGASGNVR